VRNLVKSLGFWLVGKASSSSRFASEMGITAQQHGHLANPYGKSVWVNRAIKKIATPISSVPLVFADPMSKELVEDPDLTNFWRDPFVDLTFEDGIEATVGWLKLKGECFWVLPDEWMVPFPSARVLAETKLYIPNPERMREVVEGGRVIAWHYQDANGRGQVFDPEQVIQHKFWNPKNPHRGLAEMKCAEIAAESDYLAGQMGRNLNRSNGDRGVYVMAKGVGVTGEQREQIIAQLRAKQRANANGQAIATFLNGGDFSIEDPKLQSLDSAQLAARLHNRHEIFIAFGVPASMADVQASYSIGAASDRFILIEDTCMPTGNKICGGVEKIASRMIGRDVQAKFDWRQHSVMQQVRAEQMTNVDTLWSKGMPMKEINEVLDLGLPEYSGWELGYLPMNLLPADQVSAGSSDPTNDPSLAEERSPALKAAPEVESMLSALRARAASPASAPQTRADEDPEAAAEDFQDKRPKREIKLWQAQMTARRATLKKYQGAFTRTLFEQRKLVLQKIDELYSSSGEARGIDGTVTRAAAGDLNFTLGDYQTALFTAMRRVSTAALQEAGEQVYREIELDDPFVMADTRVIMHLRARENLLKGATEAIHRDVLGTLEAGIQAGESRAKLAARVKATFNGISDRRALTIAQTETGAVFSAGREEGMRQAGVTHKQWITSGNRNVRPAHARANGQTVKVDEDFDVDGEPLAHPNDPNGSAENTINCHCIHIAVKAPKEG